MAMKIEDDVKETKNLTKSLLFNSMIHPVLKHAPKNSLLRTVDEGIFDVSERAVKSWMLGVPRILQKENGCEGLIDIGSEVLLCTPVVESMLSLTFDAFLNDKR